MLLTKGSKSINDLNIRMVIFDFGSVKQTVSGDNSQARRVENYPYGYCKSNTILPGNQMASFCAVVPQLASGIVHFFLMFLCAK